MKDRRTEKDRRKVRDTTDKIDISELREARETQEYKAVSVPRTEATLQLPSHVVEFVEEEAKREGVSFEIAASMLMTTGIKIVKQVRQWRKQHPFIEAKSTDSYYANASRDYRREQ